MAGRSSQADNRGIDLFGLLVSGKNRDYHTFKSSQTAPPPTGLTATGGIISDYAQGPEVYRAHVFTTSGTFNVSAIGDFGSNIEYLVVGGGGASGSSAYSGGGGAGGFRTNVPGHPLASPVAIPVATSPGTYPISIGAGGARGTSFGTNELGTSGNPSSFTSPISSQTVIAYGGGRGGAYNGAAAGAPGGSGGGGSANDGAIGEGYNPTTPTAVITAVPLPDPYSLTQGNPGGLGNGTGGAGGGGAGGAGTAQPGGSGGAGSPILITGTDVTYAAGGDGEVAATENGTDGTGSTGNGGIANGAAGGSGIVVVRYQIGQLAATAKASGGLISYHGNKTVHVFTGSGTFAAPGSFDETVDYLILGGGGAGGTSMHGAGGGAGGYRAASTPFTGPFSYTVVVGAGGRGSRTEHDAGGGGGWSQLGPLYVGGGGGGNGLTAQGPVPESPQGSDGGSSGGTSYNVAVLTSGPYGNDGGAAESSPAYGCGGGGGAGGAGGAGTTNSGGHGGTGVQLPSTFANTGLGYPGPSGDAIWLAGGGGGSLYATDPGGKGGGPGGPYAGAGNGSQGAGAAALLNSGSGGGGSERSPSPSVNMGGAGGSGIVLIAYPT